MNPPTTEEKIESLTIEQDNKMYNLTLKIQNEELTLVVSEPEEISVFTKKMKLNEIKDLDGYFAGLKSCSQFSNQLKRKIKDKKVIIIKKKDNLYLNFTVESYDGDKTIELILLQENKNQDELIKDLHKEISSLKDIIKNDNKDKEIKELKEEINKFKQEINNLKEEVKEIKNIKEQLKEIKTLIDPINNRIKEININRYTKFNEKSVIMEENEFEPIKNVIQVKMNKKIKELKKLYQATVDGDSAQNFHSKCDGIPNSLVIIRSANKRRFGGFTSLNWHSYDDYQRCCDKNAFLFSIDKNKIFPYIGNEYENYNSDNKYAICFYKYSGPIFGGFRKYKQNYSNDFDIYIGSRCTQDKSSYTFESNPNSSYKFKNDDNDNDNALSEDGNQSKFYVSDYEVFQIIFE